MSTELYFTLLYHPHAGESRAPQERSRTLDEIERARREALDVMAERTQTVERMLRDFGPRLLGSYRRDGAEFSELLEGGGRRG